ncbi:MULTISPECIES: extracellular solute-binding protein [Gordonia]|uniref:extracellular solute-binding protein n=1 Tax=Gordonia TaxID=2053 RepID=UPI000426CA52|nr:MULTISPECIES: extracellular solute-binding protein [Gordonia]KAF0968707.1 Trehalose-binding lipoprotein LpqY [Gordonia sp. YY1]MCZ0912501.1 extracellular solute-binding protein [Gordonia amicalis]MCZ4577968.1 extracellular solute-binding protein [Gordonia amicalis]
MRSRVSRYRTTSRVRRKVLAAAVAAAAALPVLSACGSGYEAGVLNFYPPADGADTFAAIGDKCSAESNGEYKIVTTPLPKGADDQRLQLARRLAGNDSGLDLMGMDVVWTAEFADAGWMVPVPDAMAAEVSARTLGGPLDTAVWKTDEDERERLYAIPFSTNTQLLWYRKDVLQDKVDRRRPASTWDGMLEDALVSGRNGGPTYIMVQGRQYEGLMVWFNSVLVSAGGQVVDPENPDKVTLNDTPEHRAATVRALRTLKAVATAPGADPSLTNSDEGAARLGMESGEALYEVNWPFVFPGMRENAVAGSVPFLDLTKYADLYADSENPPSDRDVLPLNREMQKVFDFAPYPGFEGLPTKTTLGGINIAVASTSEQPDLAFRAAECITSEASQKNFSLNAGPPPVIESIYDDADFRLAYPMAQEIKRQLEPDHAAIRPKSPDYQAISTLLQAKLSPVGAWDPETLVDELAEAVQKAIDGEGLVP